MQLRNGRSSVQESLDLIASHSFADSVAGWRDSECDNAFLSAQGFRQPRCIGRNGRPDDHFVFKRGAVVGYAITHVGNREAVSFEQIADFRFRHGVAAIEAD